MNRPLKDNPVLNLFPTLRQTTCPYCGVGCGVDATMDYLMQPNGSPRPQLVSVAGTPEHPANFGKLCVKGSRLVESNSIDGRLLTPQISGTSTTWEKALDKVASGFHSVIQEHGADAVAFYVSGQLLTEDYYVANKLMKGYIGSANIDTNSRLCMSSAVAAYTRAFGADSVPCNYQDLEQSELVVLVGSNAAWTHPVVFQRIERAKKLNPSMKVVVIDPRKTDSCTLADLHLPISSGSDVALFNGLLRYLHIHEALDRDYIEAHTEHFQQALDAANSWTEERVSQYCGLEQTTLNLFFRWYAQSDSTVTVYSMGVNQSTSGVDKANAIINCHLATGKIGRVGCGPFSMTGQPNAMGGREVGGLSNMLTCHMALENPEHRNLVQEFWQSPAIADKSGYKALDLFQAVEAGKVKALWVMATNPVVSMPNREFIEKALNKCELVVVSDCVASNDTITFADVVLPATGWSEKNGTVTNSERRISRQRGLMMPAGEARHDWQIICDVAQRMGYSGFDYQHPHQIFKEYAKLTGYKNNGSRDLDISGLAKNKLTQYDAMSPVQWPVVENKPTGTERLFESGHFFTKSGKAQFIAIHPKKPKQQTCQQFPFVLNSGRIRDQWHTMTRTGKVAELSTHTDKPSIHINQQDAQQLNITDGQLVKLSSSVSKQSCILHAKLDNDQRRGEVFAPMHWNAEFGSHCSINRLYASVADPISGQPELKHGAVAIEALSFKQYLAVLCRKDVSVADVSGVSDYCLKQRVQGGYVYSLAFDHQPVDWFSILALFAQDVSSLISITLPKVSCWLQQQPEQQNTQQSKQQNFQELQLVAWLADKPIESNPQWYQHLLQSSFEEGRDLLRISSMTPSDEFLLGKIVCSCFEVREKSIHKAIDDGCKSVEDIAAKLKCGTNCGSCKTELSNLLMGERGQLPESGSSTTHMSASSSMISITNLSTHPLSTE